MPLSRSQGMNSVRLKKLNRKCASFEKQLDSRHLILSSDWLKKTLANLIGLQVTRVTFQSHVGTARFSRAFLIKLFVFNKETATAFHPK